MKNVFKVTVVAIMILSCILFGFSCNNASTSVSTGDNTLDVNQTTPSSNSSTVRYLKAQAPNAGFKKTAFSRTLTKTETKVIEQTVTDRNPWLFCAGLVGAIIYAVGNTYSVNEVYTVKYYKMWSVENETIWAMTPVYYSGGNMHLGVSKEQITEKSISETVTKSVHVNFGIDIKSIFSIGADVGYETSLTQAYNESIAIAESTSYELNGYEKNKYYRIALKMDYDVYEVVVTDSKNQITDKYEIIDSIPGSIYARLESSSEKITGQ